MIAGKKLKISKIIIIYLRDFEGLAGEEIYAFSWKFYGVQRKPEEFGVM